MQSVQLPKVGILLSKKGCNGKDADLSPKVFVNYEHIRKWHQIMELRFGGRYSQFWLVMPRPDSGQQDWLVE
jgi:hypothetical protein